MAEVPFSYGYKDQTRDLAITMALIQQDMPVLLSLIKQGQAASNHKVEWTEEVISPEQTTLTSKCATTATKIVVASKLPFSVNAIIRFEGYEEIMRVTSISEVANEVNVSRAYSGATKQTGDIAVGSKVVIVSKPQHEGSRAAHIDQTVLPDSNFNYSEIFREEALISRSAPAIQTVPGSENDPVGSLLDRQVELKMQIMAYRKNNALIYGRRTERVAKVIPGTMGGLLQFHEAGNIVNAGGNAISQTLLDDGFEKCFTGGATGLNTMLLNSSQARAISALYDNKLTIVREDKKQGHVVYQVQSGLPISGYITNIVLDPAFPQSMISISDINRVMERPLRSMTDEDSRAGGDDFESRILTEETSVEFNNWGNTSVLIKNLSTGAAE